MTQEERTSRINDPEKELGQLKREAQEITDTKGFHDERLRILGEAAEKIQSLTKEGDKFTMFIAAASNNDKQAVIAGSGDSSNLSVCISLGIKKLGEELRLSVIPVLIALSESPI